MTATAVAPKQSLVPATLEIPIIVENSGPGSFYAYSAYLPGLHIDGETLEEAFSRAKRAAAQYLESIVRHRDPLPSPDTSLEIAEGAVVRKITLEWPSVQTSGSK